MYAKEILGVTDLFEIERLFKMIRCADGAYLTQHFKKASAAAKP